MPSTSSPAKARRTSTTASTSRMPPRNRLPRPSPRAAPAASPPMVAELHGGRRDLGRPARGGDQIEPLVDHPGVAEVRVHGGEGVRSHGRVTACQRVEERRLSGVGQAHEPESLHSGRSVPGRPRATPAARHRACGLGGRPAVGWSSGRYPCRSARSASGPTPGARRQTTAASPTWAATPSSPLGAPRRRVSRARPGARSPGGEFAGGRSPGHPDARLRRRLRLLRALRRLDRRSTSPPACPSWRPSRPTSPPSGSTNNRQPARHGGSTPTAHTTAATVP